MIITYILIFLILCELLNVSFCQKALVIVLINTGIKKVDHVVYVVKQVHCTKVLSNQLLFKTQSEPPPSLYCELQKKLSN